MSLCLMVDKMGSVGGAAAYGEKICILGIFNLRVGFRQEALSNLR